MYERYEIKRSVWAAPIDHIFCEFCLAGSALKLNILHRLIRKRREMPPQALKICTNIRWVKRIAKTYDTFFLVWSTWR